MQTFFRGNGKKDRGYMKHERTQRVLNWGMVIVSVPIIAFLVGTIVRAAMFVVPVSDDYWYAGSGIGVDGFFNRIVSACKFTHEAYGHEQGAYFTSFIGSFFNPIIYGGFSAMRVTMVINAVLVFAAVIFLTCVIMKKTADVGVHVVLFVIVIVVFPLTAYDSFREVFYWFSGACAYGVPISFGLTSIGLFIIYNLNKEVALTGREPLFFAAILGAATVGASLAITGIFVYFLLCTIIYFAIKRRRLEKDNMIVFITCLAGAVINMIAPGNLTGHGIENSGAVDVKAGIGFAAEHYKYVVRWLFFNRNYLVLVISLMVVGYLIYDRIKLCKAAWIVVGVMFFASPVVTVFAQVMGYGMEQIPNGCFFITVMATTAAFDNLALFIGWLMGRALKGHKKMSVLAVLYAIIFVCFIATPFSPGKYSVVMLNKKLYSGELQKNYVETKKLTDSFANMKGKDVKVDVPTNPETIGDFYSFFLLDDPDSRINSDVAKVYGLSSISNIREE